MFSQVFRSYGGQVNRVTDVVRCVVVLDTPSDILKLIKASLSQAAVKTLVFLLSKLFLMHVLKLAENHSKCQTMQFCPQLSACRALGAARREAHGCRNAASS